MESEDDPNKSEWGWQEGASRPAAKPLDLTGMDEIRVYEPVSSAIRKTLVKTTH
jgi:hypothetical protein